MITNPGFSFSGISGTHKIVPIHETDLESWGENYNECIVCTYDSDLVKVYDNGPGFSYTDKSVAMEFASIKPTDRDAIIDFCNRYGMPGSMRQFGNFRNDYLFFKDDKDSFSKAIPLGNRQERVWLYTVQRDILQMQMTIELNQSIQDRNLQRIIEILLYFCFDLHGLDFEGSQRHTETFQFNHYFYRYAEENGFTLHTRLASLSIHDLITGFLKDIENDYYETEMYHSYGFPRKEKYVQFSFSTWQHLYDLFSFVTEKEKVLDITPFGEVIMSDSLSGYINTFSEKDADGVLMCAKAVFSDIFKEHLHSVYPEMVFSKNGDPESSWRIPSLLDAMYLELFFRFSPNSSVRKCQNPDCPNYYTRTSSRPKKIYCSESCALLMAKRMERDRKRKAKNKQSDDNMKESKL